MSPRRVTEAEVAGVESLTREGLDPLGKARAESVHRVAHKRMPRVCHMYPNLMGSAGFQDELELAGPSKLLEDAVVRYRRPSLVTDHALLEASRIPSYGALYGALTAIHAT